MPPVADEARMTREKIRILGSELRYATETTIFSTEVRGPVLGTLPSVEKERNTRYKINCLEVFEEV